MNNFNNDVLFTFIYSTCLFYTPSKTNQKKIKQLFDSFPFFLSNPLDRKHIFETIKKIPITSYYDSNKTMIDYSYLIYRDYHKKIKKKFLIKKDYINHYHHLLKDHKEYDAIFYQRKINNILFFILIIIFFYFIYEY